MSLLDQFNDIYPKTEQAFATITGQRGGGKVVAQTPSGASIVLTGTLATGKKCFYDRRTSTILGEAPNVTFKAFGV